MSEEEKKEQEAVEEEKTTAEDTEEAVEATEEEATEEETAEEETVEASEEGENPEGEEADASDEKKGFFKKKKDKKDEQIEELNDKLKRQMAEFENFRKRSEKEKTQMFDMGARSIIEKILPVIDNFERGFTTVEEADKEDAFVQGMDAVYRQLMKELDAVGVKSIECLGEDFNPDFHNAVMQQASDQYESGKVAAELQKGYTYKGTVVRHSMVAVVP